MNVSVTARESTPAEGDTTTSVRGSALMLAGRIAAMGVSFVAQVLIVRHLTKAEYGAFAWALSAVLLLQSVIALGLDRADTRFFAHYDETRQHGRLRGLLVIEASTVTLVGLAAVGAVVTLRAHLGDVVPDSNAVTLLIVMLVLAPLQALDAMVLNLFAVFADAWSVFFRRYVLEPGLRLLVAVGVVVADGSAQAVALGYVAAAVVGLGIYVVLLARLLERTGLSCHFASNPRELPFREVFTFSLPLLLSNLVAVATTELAAIVLGRYSDSSAVASFRAVQPIAALNLVVMYSFMTLFTPAAARAIARRNVETVRDLYWHTASWITVLTAPVLLLTTVFARPVVETTLGPRYLDSAPYLAALSLGYFVNAALGFNGLVVQMLGRLRFVMVTNVAVLAFMIVANLLVIPLFGAGGAAVAVLATLLMHNAWKQAGLAGTVGIWNGHYARVIAGVAAVACVSGALEMTSPMSIIAAVGIAVVAGLVLLRANHGLLRIRETFPEVARLPGVRHLL